MTTINLHEYLYRIEKLIEEGQLTEAIGHCRNILEKHPRHVDTYRLLAKALLEQHAYDDASDMFQRILSADPNDFISHVGMSMVRSETEQFEQSLWHLERAFEIEPYNAAIQEELRRHYAQLSDMAVDRIPLTSGALARLYIKGELYHQAVQELRTVLQGEKDRIDLEVLLAEALWRDDQRIDAEEICLDVLERLPNCIVINAILSEIWLQTGRIGESQKYLQRLQHLTSLDKNHLDLDTVVGQAFLTDGAPSLPDEVTLEFSGDFDVGDGETGVAAKGPSADWMSDVSFDAEMSEEFEYGNEPGIVSETPSGMHSYDWIADVNDGIDAEEEDIPKPESEWFMDPAASEPDLDIEDEFKRLFAEGEDEAEEVEEVMSELDWFQEDLAAADELAAETDDAPGWLSDIIVDSEAELRQEDLEPVASSSDWFADVESEGEPDIEDVLSRGADDWLGELSDDAAEPALSVESEVSWESEIPLEETPDWLQDVTEDSAAEPELEADDAGVPLTDAAELAGLDDWLADVENISDEPESDITDWLAEAAEAADAEEAAAEPEGLAEWLQDAEVEPVEETPSGMMVTAAALLAEDDLDDVPIATTDELVEAGALDDDWLSDYGDEEIELESAPADSDEALDLEDLADVPSEILTPTSAGDSDWLAAPGDDWIEGLDEVEETLSDAESSSQFESQEAVSNAQEELPDWLLGEESEDSMEEGVVTGDKDEKEEKEPEFDLNADEDWLSELGAEAGAEEEALPSEETAVPDWLSAEEPEAVDEAEEQVEEDALADLFADEADSASWLTDMGIEQEEPEAEDAVPGAVDSEEEAVSGGLTAWLASAPEGEGLLPEDEAFGEFSLDEEMEEAAEDGLTTWLAEMSDDEDALADEAQPTLEGVDEAAAAGGLTSWLAKMSDEEEPAMAEEEEEPVADDFVAGGLTAWLSDEPEAELPAAADDIEWDFDEDEGPDWLGEEFEEEAELEAAEAIAAQPVAQDDEIEWDLEEEEGLDWLSAEPAAELDEVMADEATAVAAALQSESDDDLIDDIPDIPSEELFATDHENLPDWLSEGPSDVADLAEGTADLPDWLSDLEHTSTDVPPALDSDDLLSSDGLPEIDDDLFADFEDEEEDATTVVETDAPLPEMPELEDLEELEGLTPASLTELLADTDEESSLDDLELDIDTSWLEEISDKHVVTEQPSEEMLVADEVGLDWLTAEEPAAPEPVEAETPEPFEVEMPETAVVAEEEDEALLESVDIGVDGSVEDLDDAMSWLEDLASQQETPVDDMPTVAKDVLADELGDRAAVAAGDAAAEEVTDEDTWLDVLMTEEEALAAAEAARQEAEERAAAEDAAAAEGPPEDIEDAMVWLEGLAAKQGAPIEELPSQQHEIEPYASDFGEVDGELEDIDTWLEGIQTEQEETVAEEDRELAEALDFLEEQVLAEGITADVSGTSVSDDELAEALAWLETAESDQPAAEVEPEVEPFVEVETESDIWLLAETETAEADTAVVEEVELELPELEVEEEVETLLEISEIEAEAFPELLDMPDDPEAAMAWLEAMAGSDDDLEIDMEPPPISPSEDAAFAVDYGATEETEADEAVEGDFELELAEEVTAEADLVLEVDELAEAAAESEAELLDLAMADIDEEEEGIDLLDMPDDPDEAMAWLEAMAAGEGDIEIDMEPPPISPSEDAAFAVDYGTAEETDAEEGDEADVELELAEEITAEADLVLEVDELAEEDETGVAGFVPDEEEAVTEIETAAEVAEILAEADAEADIDEFDMFDMPEDPDDAMAWLESMAAGEGDIEIDMEPPPISPSEDAAFAVDYGGEAETAVSEEAEELAEADEQEVGLAETVEDVLATAEAEENEEIPEDLVESITPHLEIKTEETLAAAGLERLHEEEEDLFDLSDLGDDDEDALAWLQSMADGQEDIEFDMEPPPISPSEDAAFAVDYGGEADTAEDILADVPDDPDEAMAWLEKMADQQVSELGDDVGEIPLMAETPMPAWLQPGEDEPELPDVDEIVGAERGAGELDIIENLGVDIEDDLSDSLPDWFSMDEKSGPPTSQTGWLRSIEKIDVGSWLEAEEEVTGKEVDTSMPSLPDTGEILRARGGTGPLPTLDRETSDLPAESPEVRPAPAIAQVDDTHFSQARSAIEANRFDEAAGQYQQMIASGTGTMALINELESVSQEYPDQPAFRRLLGDAYMRNGQLQKALNTYRDALDHL